jgi:hypothetical protein
MKGYKIILFTLLLSNFFLGCQKETQTGPTPPPPPPADKKISISNLVYSPDIVPIKLYEKNFNITGSIHFLDAKGGVAKLRLHTSIGTDTTVLISGSTSQTSGDVTGFFEFVRPVSPAQYTFEIWLIDNSGTESNKLSGTVSVIFDDRAVSWWSVNTGSFPYYVMNKVAWFNNQFISVGLGGRLETSHDGVTWVRQNTQTDNNLNGITWTGTQYIAVGERNTIITSPDGSNWTVRNSGVITDGYLESVCVSGNTYVAVGSKYSYTVDSAEIFYSNDGITWNSNSVSNATNYGILESVLWAGNQFVAVGKGREGGHDYAMVLTSPDGKNWTDRSIYSLWVGPSNYISGLYDFIWTGAEFIAVGGVFAKSTDGITWNVTQLPSDMHTLFGIINDGKKYIVVGHAIYLSNDAVNWNRVAEINSAGSLYENYKSVAWSGLTYVVVGSSDQSYLLSP